MNEEQMLAELAKLDKLAENRNINKTHMYGRFFEKHRDYFLASIASKAKSVPVGFCHKETGELKSVITSDDGDASNWLDVFAAPQQADKVLELETLIDDLLKADMTANINGGGAHARHVQPAIMEIRKFRARQRKNVEAMKGE